MMAALGGIILASRLRSVDTGAGGGQILLYSIAAAVIGGTSLFGGRGHIKSAVLGALVIALDRQRAGPARPGLGHEVRHHRLRPAAGRDRRLAVAAQAGEHPVEHELAPLRWGCCPPPGSTTRLLAAAAAPSVRGRGGRAVADARRARRSTPRSGRSRARTAPTRSCWRTRRSTRSTSRLPNALHVAVGARGAARPGKPRAVREADGRRPGGRRGAVRAGGGARARVHRGVHVAPPCRRRRRCASSSRRARSASCA